MTQKLRFIHVGRLVEEKGTHHILHMVDELADSGWLDQIELHMYGDGSLAQQVADYASKYENIFYYGRKPKHQILPHRGECHYTLMPSTFLETFGLSALDSLSVGVPVVGYSKGGLEQFILPTYDLTGRRLSDIVIELCKSYTLESHLQDSQWCLDCFQQYSQQSWLEKFQSYSSLKPGSKILFVSDYIVDMGGIESVILNMQHLLCSAGYQVELVGKNTHTYGKARRMDMFTALRNRPFARLLTKKVEEWNPDLIWRHSVMRYIGVASLQQAQHFTQPQWIMHHDFGLFHPFPSLVTDEKQLLEARTYQGYIREGSQSLGLKKYLTPLKWKVSSTIRTHLQGFEKHLVPSPYMMDHITWYFPTSDVLVFPHFI